MNSAAYAAFFCVYFFLKEEYNSNRGEENATKRNYETGGSHRS